LQDRTIIGTIWREETVKRLPAFFYELPVGRGAWREWLKALDAADRKILGEDIKDVEFPGRSECAGSRLRPRLWEVRSTLTRPDRAGALLYSQ